MTTPSDPGARPERLASDIAAEMRRTVACGWGIRPPLLLEAAGKLDGLIDLLAKAETDRDAARAELAEAHRINAANQEGSEYAEGLLSRQDAKIGRLERKLEEARADAEKMRLALAMHGDGVDPEGHYEGTPGWRLRKLLAEHEQLLDTVRRLTSEREGDPLRCAVVELRRAGIPIPLDRPESLLAAAEARGYAKAVAVLRSDDRFANWWTSVGAADVNYRYWESWPRNQLADFLETIAKPLPGSDK